MRPELSKGEGAQMPKFTYSVSYTDLNGSFGSVGNAVIASVSAALDEYAKYIQGTTTPIQVRVVVSQLQNALAPAYISDFTYDTFDGGNAIRQSRLVSMLTTGTDPGYFPNRPTPNNPEQLTIALNPVFFSTFALVGPNESVPADKVDATSEFIGLIGQALGANSSFAYRAGSGGFLTAKDPGGRTIVQPMDPFLQIASGAPYFAGATAMAVNNGQPVQLGRPNIGAPGFFFLSDLTQDDVFNVDGNNNQQTFLQSGKHYVLSGIDLAVLHDVAPTLQITVPQKGTSADDVFRPVTNIAESYDGLGGRDTAVYEGSRLNCAVAFGSGGTFTVTSKTNVSDIDTFANIERIHFSDGVLIFDGGANALPAYRLYQAAFARVPDEGGLLVQAHQAFDIVVPQKAAAGAATSDKVAGFTISTAQYLAEIDVAARFIAAPEFIARYGATVSDGQFVDLLYQNVLARPPDPDGRAVQVNALQAGMSRATLLANFAESAENVALTSANTAVGLWSTIPDPAFG
jgi:hypothetical protein